MDNQNRMAKLAEEKYLAFSYNKEYQTSSLIVNGFISFYLVSLKKSRLKAWDRCIPKMDKLNPQSFAVLWEERVRQEAKVQIAQSLTRKGWSGEEIAETTGLDLGTVESLFGSTV
ncbi:MAG: hypothetical protein LBD29_05810 [Treponema sp.]|jgi:hypothetical protein|nr:hypothetical protein [Treponema sp.]